MFAACFRYGRSSRNPRAPPKDSFARSSGRSGRAAKVESGRACGGPGGDAPRTLSPGQEHQTEEAERSSGVRGVGASSPSPAVFTAPFCSAALRSPFCGRAPHGKPAPLAVLAKPLCLGRFNDERFRPSIGPLKLVLFRAARCGRSGNRARGRARTRPPARRDRAHRLGEYRVARGARGAGVGADQQICGRLSTKALLRRLPIRRYRGEPGDRARMRAVRLPLRQCPAQFREPGQSRAPSWPS